MAQQRKTRSAVVDTKPRRFRWVDMDDNRIRFKARGLFARQRSFCIPTFGGRCCATRMAMPMGRTQGRVRGVGTRACPCVTSGRSRACGAARRRSSSGAQSEPEMTHATEVTLVVLLAGAMVSLLATLSLAASRNYRGQRSADTKLSGAVKGISDSTRTSHWGDALGATRGVTKLLNTAC